MLDRVRVTYMASLSYKSELAESAPPEWQEARAQKRVVVLLWVAMIALVVLGGILLYAQYHGLFEAPGSGAPYLSGLPSS